MRLHQRRNGPWSLWTRTTVARSQTGTDTWMAVERSASSRRSRRPSAASCTRARLSTDGKLFTCLFAGDGRDLQRPYEGREQRRRRPGGVGDGRMGSARETATPRYGLLSDRRLRSARWRCTRSADRESLSAPVAGSSIMFRGRNILEEADSTGCDTGRLSFKGASIPLNQTSTTERKRLPGLDPGNPAAGARSLSRTAGARSCPVVRRKPGMDRPHGAHGMPSRGWKPLRRAPKITMCISDSRFS